MKLCGQSDNLTEDERRRFWATVFGLIGPEWMIIVALADAAEFTAESDAISKTLNVGQTFVYAHARRLEKQGQFIARRTPEPLSYR
jgi:DNA-binding MarR family transcriptional regulator